MKQKIERYIIPLKDNYFFKNSKLYKTLLQMAIVDDEDFKRSCQLINHYQLNGKIQVYYDYDVSTLLKAYPITNFRRVLKGHWVINLIFVDIILHKKVNNYLISLAHS